jgi:hypothetical protein
MSENTSGSLASIRDKLDRLCAWLDPVVRSDEARLPPQEG